ncbi:MAG: tetratricopeptide repeat protein [Lutibacter sp.]|uniref:tetratricopeptide repeat-containing sensor histidine kinase n=1 Tax=Lutibacter sp. TaxID=1925666 RepID=UPI00299DA4ED|nr:tetratricopeptide repeat protein [Lutibacter sp.]MDX1829760.1 tetratricopeptide repeat protein [Lutibacter sp.]
MSNPKPQTIKFIYLFYFLLFINGTYSQSYKDSLLIKLKNSKSDTLKIKLLNKAGDYYYYTRPDTSYVYYKQALSLSKKIKNKKFEARSLLNIGYYLDDKERYKESLEYYLKAIDIYKSINDQYGIAKCYNYIGYSFAYINSLENSVKYYKKSIKIYKKLNDSLGIADVYTGFGNIYYEQKKYTKAYDFYKKAYDIYILLKDKEGLNSSYINLGNTISDQGNIQEGLTYYFKSLKLCKELKDKESLAINYVNIGESYTDSKKYNKAIIYLDKSLKLSDQIEYKSLYPLIYANIAKLNLKQKKYKEVILNANKSLEYSKKEAWVNVEFDAHKYLSEAYANLGNFKKAYKNQIIYKQYTDSVYSKKNVELLTKLDVLSKVENQEKKINLLTENKKIGEIKVKNQRTLIYVLSVFSLFFISLVIILNKQINKRKKAYNLLAIEKERAEESERLKSSFLMNMSHEIRTPMNSIIGFSEFLKDPNLEIEKRLKFADVIIVSGYRLLRTINDIVDISKLESNQVKLIYSKVDINSTLKEVVKIQKETNPNLKKKNIILKLNLPEPLTEIFTNTDEDRLVQIINNLINNAIKFTDNGFIEVGYTIQKDPNQPYLQFYVKDTGIGIPKEKIAIIFKRFSQIGEKYFKEGNGLGLSICKGLVTLLEGKIWLTSEPNKGTTFYFSIPYKNIA